MLDVSGLDVSGPDPFVRLSRIRLSSRVRDGEAFVWPRVEDRGLGELIGGGVLDAVSDEGRRSGCGGVLDAVSDKGRRSGCGGAACAPDVADMGVLARFPTADGE